MRLNPYALMTAFAMAAVSAQSGAAIRNKDIGGPQVTAVSFRSASPELRDPGFGKASFVLQGADFAAIQAGVVDPAAPGVPSFRQDGYDGAFDAGVDGPMPSGQAGSVRSHFGFHPAVAEVESPRAGRTGLKRVATGRPAEMTPDSVPEPGNWAMLVAGLLGAGAIARRRLQG